MPSSTAALLTKKRSTVGCQVATTAEGCGARTPGEHTGPQIALPGRNHRYWYLAASPPLPPPPARAMVFCVGHTPEVKYTARFVA